MEAEPLYTSEANPYSHPETIVYGAARIIFAEGIGLQPACYHLPGGRMTTNKFEAMDAAIALSKLITQCESARGTWP